MAHVQVGEVENARGHRRGRLYAGSCARTESSSVDSIRAVTLKGPKGVRFAAAVSSHHPGRLGAVANESPELFDDVYLGLRAGGAVRKQRRGEPLSAEDEDAIGRWRRLSLWRKFIAIGAFALGTFGLGLTVGGLIFGRWREGLRRKIEIRSRGFRSRERT